MLTKTKTWEKNLKIKNKKANKIIMITTKTETKRENRTKQGLKGQHLHHFLSL